MAVFNVTVTEGVTRVQVGENTLAAANSATLSQAWAESPTAPGGAGTKSSKTWAGEAAGSASAAADILAQVDGAFDAEVAAGIAALNIQGASLIALATAKVNEAVLTAATIAASALLIEQNRYRITALEAKAGPAVNGDVIEAQIMDDGLPMPGMAPIVYREKGKILRIRFKGLTASGSFNPALASFTAVRPGFGTDRVWRRDNVVETVSITGLYRLSHPNSATRLVQVVGSDLDTYWAISDSMFVEDRAYLLTVQAGFYGACTNSTFAVITNSSTRPYEMPIVDLLGFGFDVPRMTAAGLYCEWAVTHHAGRNGQMVAAIEPYVRQDRANPASPTSFGFSNAMAQSLLVNDPLKVPCFPATVPIGPLSSSNVGGLSLLVYPWVYGSAPWDLAAHGEASELHNSMPAFHPVFIDLDNSFAPVRGYVSHTGAQIGTPAVTTSALPAYDPGVTSAFASVAAVMAAGRTFNASGANRARPHDDICAVEAVLPNGTIVSGLGGDLSNVTTYPVGEGPMPAIVAAAGADRATTGITFSTTAANKRFRHLTCRNISLVCGASGTVNHTVLLAAIGNSAAVPANRAATSIIHFENCRGAGNGDNSNQIVLTVAFRSCRNGTFSNVGTWINTNRIFWNASIVHGGTHDESGSWPATGTNAARPIECYRVAGAHWIQMRPTAEDRGRTIMIPVGHSFVANRFDFWSQGAVSLGSHARAIGARGVAFVGNILRHCNTSSLSPALQVHADYLTSLVEDRPACRNIVVMGNSSAGGRWNLFYIEVNDNIAIKEGYVAWNAVDREINNKADTMDPDGGGPLPASGYRTGCFGFRFGTDRIGNINADNDSNNGTGTAVFGPTQWLGEVRAPLEVHDVGSANMFVSNTGFFGSNTFADLGDFTPQAALRNRVPAGRTWWPHDLYGRAIPTNGTAAAGAVQVA